MQFHYKEYLTRFDEIYSVLSREAVYSGAFDSHFGVGVSRQGSSQFDDHFLKQVRSWRVRLANDLHGRNPTLTAEELTYFVQLFLSRLVFLRICEDRDIENYGTLRELDGEFTFAALMKLLKRSDAFYDSGLFRLIADKDFEASFSDSLLKEVISELYYTLASTTLNVYGLNG